MLDYLLVEGFSDAAISFARETGLPAEIDPSMIQERMEIREAVEEGRVEEAVRRVNELDPEVSTGPDVFIFLEFQSLLDSPGSCFMLVLHHFQLFLPIFEADRPND